MANKIIGLVGITGTGKSMWEAIWLYDGFCEKIPCFSNLKMNFKHIPLKSFEDIAFKMDAKKFFAKYDKNGRAVLDELWKLADNRKCMDAINELTDLILLDARKRHIDIAYSQQYLQIDPRIYNNTHEWVEPVVFGVNPKEPICKSNPPKIMVVNRCDTNMNPLKSYKFDVTSYLNLYDSDENPYIIKEMTSAENIKRIIAKIKDE